MVNFGFLNFLICGYQVVQILNDQLIICNLWCQGYNWSCGLTPFCTSQLLDFCNFRTGFSYEPVLVVLVLKERKSSQAEVEVRALALPSPLTFFSFGAKHYRNKQIERERWSR